MARTNAVSLAISLLSLMLATPALAKGPTVKLTITGPGIAQPIELTHKDAIAPGVWSGNFMDQQGRMTEAPASDLPRYTVQFHVKLPRTEEVRMMYVVYYVWDVESDRALVQIPGVSDTWYRLNVSTISRCCQGRWFHASTPWAEAIRAALPSR